MDVALRREAVATPIGPERQHGRAAHRVDVGSLRLLGSVIGHETRMPCGDAVKAATATTAYRGLPDAQSPAGPPPASLSAPRTRRPDNQMPPAMTAPPARWYQANRSPTNTNASAAPNTGIR